MTKRIVYVIVVLLAATAVFFFHEAQKAQNHLETTTLRLENALEEIRENCEERIARLKYDYEQQLATPAKTTRSGPLAGFQRLVEARRQQSQDRIFTEVVTALDLDEPGIAGLTAAIASFESGKADLGARIRNEGGNILDPAYLEEANAFRTETLVLLRQTLTDEQYQSFLELEFDYKLDLRQR